MEDSDTKNRSVTFQKWEMENGIIDVEQDHKAYRTKQIEVKMDERGSTRIFTSSNWR